MAHIVAEGIRSLVESGHFPGISRVLGVQHHNFLQIAMHLLSHSLSTEHPRQIRKKALIPNYFVQL